MLSERTLQRYFEALQSHDGAVAASLFTEYGSIDDFRGRHHAGRKVIEAFISQVPPMKLELLSDYVLEPPRATVYGRITYSASNTVLVRWVFMAEGEQIAHLCNSRIELIPTDRTAREPRVIGVGDLPAAGKES